MAKSLLGIPATKDRGATSAENLGTKNAEFVYKLKLD